MSEELLLARIARLEAELDVRTWLSLFPVPPVEFRKAQIRSAWTSGYESGWRNKANRAPYEREHMRSAWRTGFDAGKHESEMAILKAQRPQTAPTRPTEHAGRNAAGNPKASDQSGGGGRE